MQTFLGILIPFLGTTAGAACVFFMKKSLGDLVQRSLAGFAAGVMVAASIWSLLIPAIEQSAAMGTFAFFPALLGFWLGVLFLLALDHLIPHLHVGSEQAEGPKSRLARTTMMVLAVTLHNIPEGMAVGSSALYEVKTGMMMALLLALRNVRGFSCGKHANHSSKRTCLIDWNCDSELPGGRDHLHAASRRGSKEG